MSTTMKRRFQWNKVFESRPLPYAISRAAIEDAMKKKRRYVYRSAKTGRFVSRDYAEKHPETTTRETVSRDA